MSGIAGVVRLDGAPLDVRLQPIVAAMGAQISHRALATQSVHIVGPLGVVLPAAAPTGDVLVVVDGRIHNLGELRARLGAELRKGTPEAVVARLYSTEGPGFVEQLEGTFAIMVWDARAGVLVLARDRVGARPLFHARIAGDCLLFGSEVKALLAHPDCPREVDWVATLARIASPRRSHPRTSYFRDIEPLGAGAVLTVNVRDRAIACRRYHRFEHPPAAEIAADTRSDGEIIEGYRASFEGAVSRALGDDAAASGLLLSGGIDSVSIAALAARRARIPTFTVLGQSTFGNGDARLARAAAEQLGLPNHQVLFGFRDAMSPDQWRRLVWLCETPDCAGQQFYKYHLHRFARDHHPELALMLNGEGSDELIGADFANAAEEREDATFDDYLADLADKQREGLFTLDTLAIEGWVGRPTFTRDFLARSSGQGPLPHPWQRRVQYNLDAFEHDVLWRDDRLAAANGMTSAAPFLDQHLVEYVMRIPPRAYRSLFWRKHVLREAMRPHVPDALRDVRKIPFFGGIDYRYTSHLLYDVLVADDRALLREAFGSGGDHPVLAPGLIDHLVDEATRDPARGEVYPLLVLTNLGLLESMARDVAARPSPGSDIPALRALEAWDERAIADCMIPRRSGAGLDLPLTFAANVYVVRPDTVAAGDHPSYIVVDDDVRYVLEGDETRTWREVLRRVDGERSLRSILDEIGASEAEVRKHFEEALEYEVLVLGASP